LLPDFSCSRLEKVREDCSVIRPNLQVSYIDYLFNQSDRVSLTEEILTQSDRVSLLEAILTQSDWGLLLDLALSDRVLSPTQVLPNKMEFYYVSLSQLHFSATLVRVPIDIFNLHGNRHADSIAGFKHPRFQLRNFWYSHEVALTSKSKGAWYLCAVPGQPNFPFTGVLYP